MTSDLPAARLPRPGLKFDQWPANDKGRWLRETAPANRYSTAGAYAATLRPDSLAKTQKTYGDWLGYLIRAGGLSEVPSPMIRATGQQVRGWVLEMRAANNRSTTIISRLADLKRALKIMCPREETQPLNFAIAALAAALRQTAVNRPLNVPDADVLYAWGLRLMNGSSPQIDDKRAAVDYRDGLIIALLATRARRLKAMAGLRIGLEIKRSEVGYRFDLPAELIKNKMTDVIALPSELTPFIDHYLQVVRPALTRETATEGMWAVGPGRTLTKKGLQAMIGRRSKAEYGFTFGPHRFRHALTTTALLHAPQDPSMAASVLRHTRRVNGQYDHGGAFMAVNRLSAIVIGKTGRSSRGRK